MFQIDLINASQLRRETEFFMPEWRLGLITSEIRYIGRAMMNASAKANYQIDWEISSDLTNSTDYQKTIMIIAGQLMTRGYGVEIDWNKFALTINWY